MTEFSPAARVAALPPNFWGAMDREIARLSAEPGPRMIDVSKGNPDLPTPEAIVQVMQRAVAEPVNHRYPSFVTRPALREAIAERYRVDHGVSVDPVTEVVAFHGSHEGFMAAVLALTDPGDAVLVPDPGYPTYQSAIDLASGRAVAVPLQHPSYHPDFSAVDDVEAASVLLLNYPNNPTGALATAGVFEQALVVAERTGAAFVHDFAYSSLGFDGRRPLSALAVDSALERTVEVQTMSKTYNMAGWRLGFAAGNASIIDAMRRYQAHAYSTIFGATQDAAAAALAGDQSAATELVDVYERRRDLVVAGLRKLGWDVVEPEGSFFVWTRVPGDAVDFARRLREEQRVAVSPGDGFGPRGNGFVRLSLVKDEATLAELLDRLAVFDSR